MLHTCEGIAVGATLHLGGGLTIEEELERGWRYSWRSYGTYFLALFLSFSRSDLLSLTLRLSVRISIRGFFSTLSILSGLFFLVDFVIAAFSMVNDFSVSVSSTVIY
jgi:hypothetical protein